MILKTCHHCGEPKVLSEFHKSKGHKYGVDSRCKICKQNYNIKNKEIYIKARRKHYINNREQMISASKFRYNNDHDHYRELCRKKRKEYIDNLTDAYVREILFKAGIQNP
jgi:hypothetical protein